MSNKYEKKCISLTFTIRKYLSLSLGILGVFGFRDVAKSQFVTDFSEQLAIFKAQDVQDKLILEDGLDRRYRDVDKLPIDDAP